MRRILLLLLFALFGLHYQAQAQAVDLDRIQRATVFVIQVQTTGSRTVMTCVGTGTIIDRRGFIVTNAHNTVPNRDCPGDSLIIATTNDPTQPPVPTYRAEIAQANTGLDLALLRITQELSGRLVDTEALSLPFVELGDSAQVALDDTITAIGYPSLGNEPVATFRGTVSGFVSEPSAGDRSWFKVTTEVGIPGTATGGGVYNQAGQLIGIPTTVPVISLAADATCIPVEDTDGDGLVNRSDRCVPVGGFINVLRPSNFVQPLLRGASLDITVEKLSGNTLTLNTPGPPSFERLLLSPAVTDGMPSTVVNSLPTGTNQLYLFFDYRNMTPETIYELRVSVDDIPNPNFNLPPVRWSGGVSGLWYIGLGSPDQTLPNGIYEFTLFIDGQAGGNTTIIVGAEPSAPAFSNIFFCIEADGNCFGQVYVLPTGNIVSARFIHRNVPDGTPWTADWYYNGEILAGARAQGTWQNEGENDSTRLIRLQGDGGLPPGRYRLELYIENRLSATADFTIAGASEGAFSRVFTNTYFTTADSPQDVGENSPLSSFPGDVRQIYSSFDWEQLAPGTLWRMRWSVDGVVFYEETVPWDTAGTGQNFVTRLSGIDGIPDGTYRMELWIASVELESIEAEVGIGQLALDPFAQTEGVQLNGRIIDAETREGLPGISFIVITEDFSVADFVWDQNQVYTMAVTGEDGRFQLERLLQFGDPYSLVVAADGYLPVQQDGIVVDEETDNPLEIVLPLSKDS